MPCSKDIDAAGRIPAGVGGCHWRVRRGRLVVLYDWPDAGDDATARVLSLWMEG